MTRALIIIAVVLALAGCTKDWFGKSEPCQPPKWTDNCGD